MRTASPPNLSFTGTSGPAGASSPPGHEALDPADSREVVVNHRHHQHKDDYETGQQHLLFHADAEVSARNPLERHDEDMPAVEHGDRHQAQQPEVQADGGHQ